MGISTLDTSDICKPAIPWLSYVYDVDAHQRPRIPRRDERRTGSNGRTSASPAARDGGWPAMTSMGYTRDTPAGASPVRPVPPGKSIHDHDSQERLPPRLSRHLQYVG